jgi:hypothetical protein
MGSSSISAGPELPRRIPARWAPDSGRAAQRGPAWPAPARPPDQASLPSSAETMRWCKIFAARDDQAERVRDLIAELIVERPDRHEIGMGAASLAATAIQQAARAGHGFFITEVGWSGQAVRIATAAVANSGEVTGPVFGAQFDLGFGGGQAASPVPPRPEAFVPAQAADLEWRYPAWHVWFGEATREWWAMPRQLPARDQLISAPTAEALASRLRSAQGWPGSVARPPRGSLASGW